jgi:hypothetical protein
MPEGNNFSLISLSDLAGLSAPLTRLIEVCAAGMGNLYRPMGIFREGKAEAARIRLLAAAQADAGREGDKLKRESAIANLELVTELEKRAEMRVMAEAVSQQENLERIAASAASYLPDKVSDEKVAPDWRTHFFKHARDVSDETMREVWAQILAAEVAKPGSYSLRALEVLRLMSRTELEAFGRLCALVFEPNYVVRLSLDKYGVTFNDILGLQGAAVLQDSYSLNKTFGHGVGANKSLIVTHDIGLQIEYPRPLEFSAYFLTRAARELRRLVNSRSNPDYVAEVERELRRIGFTVTRLPITRDGDQVKYGQMTYDVERL